MTDEHQEHAQPAPPAGHTPAARVPLPPRARVAQEFQFWTWRVEEMLEKVVDEVSSTLDDDTEESLRSLLKELEEQGSVLHAAVLNALYPRVDLDPRQDHLRDLVDVDPLMNVDEHYTGGDC